MKQLFVVDASGYLYRNYFAIRNMTNAKGESTNSLFGFIRCIIKLIKDFQPTHLIAVFDGPHNAKSREAIYADYKAHRSSMPPDLLYQIHWAHTFCDLYGIPYLSIPEVEADDTMGSIAEWAKGHDTDVFLCSSDKDLCQLVNGRIKMLNTFKENEILGPKEVEENFGVPPEKIVDFLSITGDSSDNVPGIPGMGPKTAVSLLKEYGSLDAILANPERIANKKRQEIILQNVYNARLSQQLVTLNTRLEIPVEPEFYALKANKYESLKAFYSQMSFNSFLKELTTTVIEETNYQVVDSEEDFDKLLDTLQKQKLIGITIAATDAQPMKGALVGVAFAIESSKAWYVPVNGKLGLERVLKGLKPLFESKSQAFFGHNLKYTLHILHNHGIDIKNLAFDTILASYILNSHSRQHSLDALILEHYGKVKASLSDLVGKGKNEINLTEAPIEKVSAYYCEEIDYTLRLKDTLEKNLKERNLLKLLKELELPLVKVLENMERTGIFLDLPAVEILSIHVSAQLKGLAEEIYTMAGEEFNLNSPKQLQVILFEKMGIKPPRKIATGHSTDADVLEMLQEKYPIAGKLMEYRFLEKMRSTYIDSLPSEVNSETQRIHCTFNQSVAATGRLSCQNPNLQNIPVRTDLGKSIREAFRPEQKSWVYLAADYSQIELRLMAHLSEDPSLLQAFNEGGDIHTWTASIIFGIPLQNVSKEQRQGAKAVNFGILYGQQAFGLSQELGIEVKDAAKFIEMYFKRFPHVKEYLERSKNFAHETGRSVTLTGRERLIPEIHSKNGMLRSAAERLAINTPLQGTAADMIKLAMLEIDKQIRGQQLQGKMVLQIHDELIFEIPQHEILLFESLVKQSMQNVYQLKVPVVVDITVGKNWKEC